MLVEKIPQCENIHLIDTHFLDHDRHVGCYVIDAEQVAIIDNGASTGVDRILEAVDEIAIDRKDVRYLLPTHVHLDHAGGTGYLMNEFPQAQVVCHERAEPFLTDEEKIDKLVSSAHRALGELAPHYGDMKPIPDNRVRTVSGGEELELGDRSLTAVEATGHAPHQMCWFDSGSNGIFVADEAGMWLDDHFLPATPPPNFDYESVLDSLDRFRDLNPDRLFFAHFGMNTEPLHALDSYEEVLTEWVQTIEELWEEHGDTEEVQERILDQGSYYFEVWDEKSARQTVKTDTTGVIVYLRNKDG